MPDFLKNYNPFHEPCQSLRIGRAFVFGAASCFRPDESVLICLDLADLRKAWLGIWVQSRARCGGWAGVARFSSPLGFILLYRTTLPAKEVS